MHNNINKLIGYVRVSTTEQSLDRQIDQLKEAGCEKIFQDVCTGTKKDREGFNQMLDYIREGDTVVVAEMTRLSRKRKHLFEIFDDFEKRNINIKSLSEAWLDTTTPQGKFLFTVFAGISQYERDLISMRVKDGLLARRKRGIVGGRPRKDKNKITDAIKLYNTTDLTTSKIAEMTGISKSSLYKYLAEKKAENKSINEDEKDV